MSDRKDDTKSIQDDTGRGHKVIISVVVFLLIGVASIFLFLEVGKLCRQEPKVEKSVSLPAETPRQPPEIKKNTPIEAESVEKKPGSIIIAYTSNWGGVSGGRKIYKLSPDGAGLTLLYGLPGCETYAPSYSKDYSKVAFYTPGRIMTINSDGTNPQTAAVDPDLDIYSSVKASWSPDSTKIAFYKKGGIYIADVNTGSIKFLINGRGSPSWSPINDQILFNSGDINSVMYFNKINASGGEPVIIKTVSPSYTGRGVPSAIWSPDGTKIAVNYCADKHGRADTVQIIDVNGAVLLIKELSNGELNGGGWNNSPTTFTPDGKYLLLASQTSIRKMDVDTGEITVLFERPDPSGIILGCCYAAK